MITYYDLKEKQLPRIIVKGDGYFLEPNYEFAFVQKWSKNIPQAEILVPTFYFKDSCENIIKELNIDEEKYDIVIVVRSYSSNECGMALIPKDELIGIR